jgi:hypothetical protein
MLFFLGEGRKFVAMFLRSPLEAPPSLSHLATLF